MTVCAAVLVAGAAAAQETPSFPARDLPAAYDTYPRLSFHDVSLGYGVMPINDVTGIMDDLLPSLVGTGEIAKAEDGGGEHGIHVPSHPFADGRRHVRLFGKHEQYGGGRLHIR